MCWGRAENRDLCGDLHVIMTVLYLIKTDPLALGGGSGGVYRSGRAEARLPHCSVLLAGARLERCGAAAGRPLFAAPGDCR